MPTIYSIGSSTRQIEEFIALLHHFHITTLVDVRSFPKSRFNHFIKENLDRGLNEAGIDYHYLGKELGGYRKGGYENYTLTTRYEKGVGHLEAIGKKDTTAFMCAERLPWKCHRKFIALSLQERGWKVLHIIDKKRVWESTQLSLFHRKEI
jgi:uncharacterized protein (DUF488 family)